MLPRSVFVEHEGFDYGSSCCQKSRTIWKNKAILSHRGDQCNNAGEFQSLPLNAFHEFLYQLERTRRRKFLISNCECFKGNNSALPS